MKFTVDMLDFTKAVDLLCDLFGGSLLSCTLKRAEHGQQGGETSQKKNGYFRSPMPQFPDIYNHLYRNIMKYILLYEYIYMHFFPFHRREFTSRGHAWFSKFNASSPLVVRQIATLSEDL